jgi:TonB family protein
MVTKDQNVGSCVPDTGNLSWDTRLQRYSSIPLKALDKAIAVHTGAAAPPGVERHKFLYQMLSKAQDITGATGVAVALVEGDELVCRAALGETAPALGVLVNRESGISGQCARLAKMLHCEDAETDPQVNRSASQHLGVKTIVALPLVQRGVVVGVFDVFSSQAFAFSNRQIDALEALSMVMAAGINGQPAHEENCLRPIERIPTAQPGSAAIRQSAHEPPRIGGRRSISLFKLTLGPLIIVLLLSAGWLLVKYRASILAAGIRNQKAVTPTALIGANFSSVPNIVTDQPSAEYQTRRRPVRSICPNPKLGEANCGVPNDAIAFDHSPDRRTNYAENRSSTHLRFAKAISDRSLIYKVDPVYPPIAKEEQVEGTVVLQALVDENGVVRDVAYVGGPAMLAAAAIDALKQWRYRPSYRNGKRIESETQVTVNFRLR